MTVKEELQRYLTLERRVRANQRIIREIRPEMDELSRVASGLTGISYDRDRVQSSGGNHVEDRLVRNADVQLRLSKRERGLKEWNARMLSEMDRIADRIGRIENPRRRRILELVYLEGLSLRGAAVRIGCTYSWVKHQHSSALMDYSLISSKLRKNS